MVTYRHNNELFLLHTYPIPSYPIQSWKDFLPTVEPESFRTDTPTCWTNTLILYICFVLQYTCSIYFLFFFCACFLAPNRPQQYSTHTVVNCLKTTLSMGLRIYRLHLLQRRKTPSQGSVQCMPLNYIGYWGPCFRMMRNGDSPLHRHYSHVHSDQE